MSEKPFQLIFASTDDAKHVIQSLEDVIKQYGAVSISDVKSLVGIHPTYKDALVGWKSTEGLKLTGDSEITMTFPETTDIV